jgi:hypothetical protein
VVIDRVVGEIWCDIGMLDKTGLSGYCAPELFVNVQIVIGHYGWNCGGN